jgi:phosphate starvation-inducible PhoH-like protein|tara:strand:+ start:598 stop:1335 length:738 start_codon:yes stop_codon:yes gene_type:complete
MATKRSRLAAVFESEQLQTNDLHGNWDLNFNVRNKFDFTENQKKFIQTILAEDTKIVFADGSAGTAKTYLSVFGGLTLLAANKNEQIVYLRSVVESANQKIGHLPGQLDEKFLPYSLPLMDKLDELVTKTTANSLFKKEYIKCLPVNFTRGLTFNNSVVIVDEAQNLTKQEITTILTRFGERSKYIVVGDSNQSDINGKSGFSPIIKAFDNEISKSKGISTYFFGNEDIVRSKILKHIVHVLSDI